MVLDQHSTRHYVSGPIDYAFLGVLKSLACKAHGSREMGSIWGV